MFNVETEILDFSKTEDYSSEVLMYCLILTDKDTKIWKLCNNSEDQIKAWMCMTASCKKTVENYDFCYNFNEGVQKVENLIKQPIVLIPLPSPTCNQKWNYKLNGDDWECLCKTGTEQSPIDLPDKRKAIDSEIRPSLNYDLVSPYTVPTLDGSVEATLQLKNSGKYVHLLHDNMGRIITQDGTIYQAQEIIFHTPANHKIDGKTFDLEVVIIHTGISKGDIAKQVTLSFLFEAAPGIYNKFFEDLDIFNIPNPYTRKENIIKSLYIPKLMYDTFDDKIELKPFSFYTYQGSLMVPPCTEQTIVYVASKPLQISTTTLFLLKEALKKPDLMSASGKVFSSDSPGVSNRKTMPINGRPIFHYEACETNDKNTSRDGHYEKIKDKSTLYFYVNGEKPSGVPGAFVVSKDDAFGNLDKI
jgi:carbonic anhydrase